jgi:Bacterial protein of unknown function (DUF898)
LALINGALSFLTLGIYRFWGKTKIRKYLWSSAEIDGDRFEYTGTGREKFLGFLVALVVLAVYMAAVQLILFGIGLRFVARPRTYAEAIGQLIFIYSTLFALMPLIAFARYRARRYAMARTRFRGIRFGMDNEAWGYMWRAVGLTILSIVSLGLLHPYQRFTLEKYMTDRGYYGDARMEQHGKWTALYGNMKHIFIGVGVIIIGGVVFGWLMNVSSLVPLVVFIGYIWIMVGVLIYMVRNFAYLTSNKVLAGDVGLSCTPKTSSVIGAYLLGGLGIGVIAAIIAFIGKAVLTAALGDLHPGMTPPTSVVVIGAIAYVAFLILIGAMVLAFITMPVIAHFIDETKLVNPDGLAAIKQRAADAGADADGFADALDLGGAF